MGLYAVISAGLGACQYVEYRNSFEPIIIYTHPTQESMPEETETATEPPETAGAETSIIVPVTEGVTDATAPPETEIAAITYPLDLNTVTNEELVSLPNIGEVLAQEILNYRAQIGGFTNRQQLLDVPGIGEKRLETLLSLVYIENEQPLSTEPVQEPQPVITQPSETVVETEPPPETEPPTIPIINLNTATKEELMLLPGCDEQIADAILHLRDQIHVFQNPLEIVMAEEVSDALYMSWADYLTVEDPAEPTE